MRSPGYYGYQTQTARRVSALEQTIQLVKSLRGDQFQRYADAVTAVEAACAADLKQNDFDLDQALRADRDSAKVKRDFAAKVLVVGHLQLNHSLFWNALWYCVFCAAQVEYIFHHLGGAGADSRLTDVCMFCRLSAGHFATTLNPVRRHSWHLCSIESWTASAAYPTLRCLKRTCSAPSVTKSCASRSS